MADLTEVPVDEQGVLRYLAGISETRGWRLTTDPKVRAVVVRGLARRWELEGAPYCPCRIGQEEAYICPCDEAEASIRDKGRCACHLFTHPNFKESE